MSETGQFLLKEYKHYNSLPPPIKKLRLLTHAAHASVKSRFRNSCINEFSKLRSWHQPDEFCLGASYARIALTPATKVSDCSNARLQLLLLLLLLLLLSLITDGWDCSDVIKVINWTASNSGLHVARIYFRPPPLEAWLWMCTSAWCVCERVPSCVGKINLRGPTGSESDAEI